MAVQGVKTESRTLRQTEVVALIIEVVGKAIPKGSTSGPTLPAAQIMLLPAEQNENAGSEGSQFVPLTQMQCSFVEARAPVL